MEMSQEVGCCLVIERMAEVHRHAAYMDFFMAGISSHLAGSKFFPLFMLMCPSLEKWIWISFRFGGEDVAFGIAAVGLVEDFVSV